MKNGDLSNDLTRRILVNLDVFRSETIVKSKVFQIIPTYRKEYSYDRAIISRLYLYADRVGTTLELIGYEMSDYDLEKVIEAIDRFGTNPFRYYSAYDTPQRLVAELPYRPEVSGVLDVPSRQLMYGHWGLDFSRL